MIILNCGYIFSYYKLLDTIIVICKYYDVILKKEYLTLQSSRAAEQQQSNRVQNKIQMGG